MEKKTIKFKKHLVPMVLSKEKYITWRVNDEKDIKEGDIVSLINWNTNEEFGRAEIINIVNKKFGDITEDDYKGHEKFKDHAEMLKTYQSYYGDWVSDKTVVKILKFELLQ